MAPSRRPVPTLRGLALAALAASAPVAADMLPVVDSAAAAARWKPTALTTPAYPRGASGQACVHLAFVIGRDGRVRDMAVLRRWSSVAGEDGEGKDAQDAHAAFAREAAAAAMAWRFEPVNRNDQPILTSINLAFDDRGRGQGPAIRAHCAVANLERFIVEAQKDIAARGNLAVSSQDRNAMSYPWQITRDRHGWNGVPGDAP